MPKKILISGCSYTENASWPSVLFPGDNIVNLGRSAAGNQFIAESILESIYLSSPPDMVFILWSGINRVDVPLPKNDITFQFAKQWKYFGELKYCLMLFSGGDYVNANIENSYNAIADPTWPKVKNLDEFLSLGSWNQLFRNLENEIQTFVSTQYLQSPGYLSSKTLKSMDQCLGFLERHNIDYRFGFIANPLDKNNQTQFGYLEKDYLYDRINWSKYVTLNPYEFGVRHNYMSDDSFHLTNEGMEHWASEIKLLTRK